MEGPGGDAFIKLYGLVGALISLVLAGAGLVALLAFGVHAWISGRPVWPGIASSGTLFACGAVLLLIGLGREWHWWSLDASKYDSLAQGWVWMTIVATAAAGIAASYTAG